MGSYLGQNFLKDRKYIDFTLDRLRQIRQQYGFQNAFEIGPGKGAITKYLSSIFDNIYLFEKDITFTDILTGIVNKENIFFGDVLDQDLSSIVNSLKLNIEDIAVVGNIPYYITSPIFRKFFVENKFKYGIFMIQKEVGERIKSGADKKSYLRWLLNVNYEVKYLKNVPARAFNPAPKVDSCLVEFRQKQEELSTDKFLKLIDVLDNISMYKRKTLGKIWKMCKDKNENFNYILPEEIAKKRLEDIEWEEMRTILG